MAENEQASTENTGDVVTQITVGGKIFQLKHMAAATAINELYPALPEDYKKVADRYATFAKGFRGAFKIQLPEGITLQTAVGQYMEAVRKGGDAINDQSKPYLAELAKSFGIFDPGHSGRALKTAAGSAVDLAGGFVAGLMDSPAALLDAFAAGKGGLAGLKLDAEITDDQAKAFGAAMAGMAYDVGQKYEGKTALNLSVSNPLTAISAGWDWAQGTSIGAWVSAGITMVVQLAKHWFSDGPAPEWGKILAEKEASAHDKLKGPDGTELGYEALLKRKLAEKDFPIVAERMKRAEHVAEVPVAPRVDALGGKVAPINQEGGLGTAKPDGTVTPITNPDGQPVTPLQAAAKPVTDRVDAIAKDLKDGNYASAVGTTGGLAAGGAAALAGTVSAGKGVVRGTAEAYREAPQKRADALVEKANAHSAQADAEKKWFETKNQAERRQAFHRQQASKLGGDASTEAAEADRRNLPKPTAGAAAHSPATPAKEPSLFRKAANGVDKAFGKVGEVIGSVFGKTGDAVVTTAQAGKDLMRGSEGVSGLAAAGTVLKRAGAIWNVAATTVMDGWDMGKHVANGQFSEATVDGAGIASSVGGGAAGVAGGAWTGGNVGMVVGGALGGFVGLLGGPLGVAGGAALGATWGRVGGSALGGLVGGAYGSEWGKDGGRAATEWVMGKENPAKPIPTKALTEEEVIALLATKPALKKTLEDACSTSNDVNITLGNARDAVTFTSCKVGLGAIRRFETPSPLSSGMPPRPDSRSPAGRVHSAN